MPSRCTQGACKCTRVANRAPAHGQAPMPMSLPLWNTLTNTHAHLPVIGLLLPHVTERVACPHVMPWQPRPTTCPNKPVTVPYDKLHVLAFLHEQRWMLSLLLGPTLATTAVLLTPGLCIGRPLSRRRASLEARSAASAWRSKWSRTLPSSLQMSPRVAW